jgi:short-subunit dehydrogenase
MKRPSFTFYVALFAIYYLFDISFFWYVFVPIIIATVLSIGFRRYVYEDIFQNPVPPRSFVVISGTSSGFGLEFTTVLAEKAITVIAGVRKIEDGDKLIQAVQEPFRRFVIPVLMDVTNQDQIDLVVQKATKMEEDGLKMIALINNAGIHCVGPMENLSTETVRKIFEVNVFGVHSLTKSFLPLIRKNQARIINIGSIGGLASSPFRGIYTSTKFALEAYSDSLRVELQPFGVHVILLEPGSFDTNIISNNFNAEVASTDQGVYSEQFNKMVTKAANKKWPKADLVAKQLMRVLFATIPPARAVLGDDAQIPQIILVANILPESVSDLLFRALAA